MILNSPMEGEGAGEGGGGEGVETVVEPAQAGDPTGGGQDVGHEPGDRPPEPDDPAADPAGDPADPVDPPAYTPDFKVKVLDKEHEIPERFRDLMTDETSATEVRDLFTRAHAMDAMKSNRDGWVQKFNGLNGSVQQINQAFGRGDLQTAFNLMKLSEDQVLRYAMDRVAYRQATPEQRAAADAHRDTATRLAALEMQNSELLGNHQNREVSQRAQELDIAVAAPDVQQVMQSFDARAGRPGAFRDEVIKRGQFYWHTQQIDIPVAQAMKEVLALVGGHTAPVRLAPGAPAPAAGQPRQAAGAPVPPRAPDKKPVIPNFAGTGQSPTREVPRSIKDLRKMGQEANRASG